MTFEGRSLCVWFWFWGGFFFLSFPRLEFVRSFVVEEFFVVCCLLYRGVLFFCTSLLVNATSLAGNVFLMEG